MQMSVEENPNCGRTEQVVYRELGSVKPIRAIRAEERGKEIILDVTGVAEGGAWVPAQSVKIADSGSGFAFLIFGGPWGIRLKPDWSKENWDLNDAVQWGEPYKIYGSEEDIIYA